MDAASELDPAVDNNMDYDEQNVRIDVVSTPPIEDQSLQPTGTPQGLPYPPLTGPEFPKAATIQPNHNKQSLPQSLADLSPTIKNVMLEHCYARPFNWRPENNFLRPTKTLFFPKSHTQKRRSGDKEELDVVSLEPSAPPIYDVAKARRLMEDCERHASFARGDHGGDDWEEKIPRHHWTDSQNHLFSVMVNILNSDRMSRLAYVGVHNEPILRRTVIDKSVKRFRQVMAKHSWDGKLGQWLHQLLIDNLSTPYLAAYFDILQTLRHKLPTFVDKLLFGPSAQSRVGPLSYEGLFPLLRRPWDPVATSLSMDKPKKLPNNPVIIILPNAPTTSPTMYSKRLHRWINLFTNLAQVHTVYNNIGPISNKMTMMNCVDQMFAATRAKIQEIKAENPTRPIILAGFNAGAALALQVAQVETVLGILCLGFSVHTVEGSRGEPEDNLLELQCPVLFVIGQCSNTAIQEHMEDIRERMRVETGLLVVGSGDDYLRVSKKKKRSEGITQSVVDRCIVDEVGVFLSGLLLSPYPPQLRQSPAQIPLDMIKRSKMDRKRHNSNGSSLDSEPPSPTPRISRPGQNLSPVLGRPPGSKSKSKIEAKWHAMQQGIPPLISTSTTPQSNKTSTPNTYDSTPTKDSTDPYKSQTSIGKYPGDKIVKYTASGIPSKQPPAKLQAMGLSGRNVYHGSTLSNLLQGGGVRTLPPNPQAKQIKVLESLTLSSGTPAGKMLQVPGRTVDMAQMKVLNSTGQPKMSNNFSGMVLMPDGKLKPNGPIRNSPMMYGKNKPPNMPHGLTPTSIAAQKNNLTKYITSKKQLMANRQKYIRKIPYVNDPSSSLPPPTNLTTQDIMDLPIIFADDNQMLANNTMQPSDTPPVHILQSTQIKPANPSSKLVFVNKQDPHKPNLLKRPMTTPTTTVVPKTNPIKYAKIILSKAPTSEDAKKMVPPLQVLTTTPKQHEPSTSAIPMDIDLENELVATAITKPNYVHKSTPVIYKKCDMTKSILSQTLKARAREQDLNEDDDSDDPEYIPSKNEY